VRLLCNKYFHPGGKMDESTNLFVVAQWKKVSSKFDCSIIV